MNANAAVKTEPAQQRSAIDIARELAPIFGKRANRNHAGGAGFYRAAGVEKRFRDIQAARYHPLQAGPQAEYAGALALGLPTDKIY